MAKKKIVKKAETKKTIKKVPLKKATKKSAEKKPAKKATKKAAARRTFGVVEDLSVNLACVFDQIDESGKNQNLRDVHEELEVMFGALTTLEEAYGDECLLEKLKWLEAE